MILTKIYINNEQIDLKDDVSIPLNFNIADIREPEKRGTTWSKTVVLPGTSFNNALFSNIWNVNAAINSSGTTNFNPNFNPNLKAEAEITYNEARQFKGICQLLNVNVTDKYEIEYEVAFFGELQNVFQFFNNKYLRDINLSEYNHTYTAFNQQLSWTKPIGQGYLYPMIDYGYGTNNQFTVQNMFPSIYVKTIIDKMFSEAGFSYESNFLNTDLFKRLVIPYSGGSTLKLTRQQVSERTSRVSKNSPQIITLNGDSVGSTQYYSERVPFSNKTTAPNNDAGNNFIDENGGANYQTFIVPKTGTYTFTTNITANVKHYPTASSVNLAWTWVDLGNILIVKNPTSNTSSTQTIADVRMMMKGKDDPNLTNVFMITASTGTTITSGSTTLNSSGSLSVTAYLNENDKIQVKFKKNIGYYGSIYKNGSTNEPLSSTSYSEVNLLTTSNFQIQLSDTNVQEGDDIDISQVLPDNIKQSDFFNSIVKAFNLFVEVDKTNSRNLLIEPRPTFYNSGVIRDWSDKLDYSKETKIIPMGETNNKTYLFTYKEDKDYFNNDYKTTYGENYGQKRYDIENDFLKGEVKTELIFSPTPLVNTIGHDRVISKIYTLDTNGTIKPAPSNIRLLYWGGLKNTNYLWQHIATSGTTDYDVYPYVGHLDDVENPTFDLNFGVPLQVYYNASKYTGNNLYNKYWRDYIEQIADKDSKIFSGYFLINEFDIQSLDFRDTFYFENEYWRLNKIIDYDRINNQPTKCEFIKLKTIPTYVDDNGIDINGGIEVIDDQTDAPTSRIGTTYNNNHVAEGALVSGRNNIVNSGDGVIVSGNDNFIGSGVSNVSLLASTGVTVLSGVSNVSITNSSGVTVTESNTTYDNNIKSYNNISYKKFVGLITQQSTSPPTIIVLENTFTSPITSDYVGVGKYNLISSGEFTIDKTFIMINQSQNGISGPIPIITAAYSSTNEIYIETREAVDETYLNDSMNNCSIEIRVYS